MSIRTQRNSLPLLCLDFKKTLLVEDWYEYFRDDFDDEILRAEWTTHGLSADKTIVESGDVVTLEVANNANAVWYCNTNNIAPKMYVPLTVTPPCRITTKLNEIPPDPGATCPDDIMAGMFIGKDPEGLGDVASHLAFLWGRYKCAAEGADALRLIRNCGSYATVVGCGAGCLPKWLKIEIDASEDIRFYYSDDGSAWTAHATVLSGEYTSSLYVGLFAKNGIWDPEAGGTTNLAAQFEYFLIEEYKAEHPIEVECLAPIDTRAPTTFYHGRIKQMSSLKRAVDDKTGLFQVADMSITLANEDKHYSQKMASQFLKNQEATLYHAWTEEPDADKIEVIKLIVEDHSMKGPDFIVKFKDITQKYFTKKVPENICTKDDFPDMSDEHVGRCKPEVLGNATLSSDYERPGAVEAVYVNTIAGWFIAANGTLHDITEVFVDGVLQTEGVGDDYTWYIAFGNTYISFTPGSRPTTDQVVTFNAHGYSVPAWDSANGYVQNLAYIIQYFLRFLLDIPHSLVNSSSFATLAAYYEDMGVSENGYLILQGRVKPMEVLRQLLFTGGAKGFMAMDGKFNVRRKNICNWEIASLDYHIFEQIELFESPRRLWNLTSAINTVNVKYGLIPWQNLYKGAKSEYKDNQYGAIMEDDINIDKDYIEV